MYLLIIYICAIIYICNKKADKVKEGNQKHEIQDN